MDAYQNPQKNPKIEPKKNYLKIGMVKNHILLKIVDENGETKYVPFTKDVIIKSYLVDFKSKWKTRIEYYINGKEQYVSIYGKYDNVIDEFFGINDEQ